MGAPVDAFYLTMGRYEMAVMVDAPNPATLAQIAVATASRGGKATETLAAFTEQEYRKVISELP